MQKQSLQKMPRDVRHKELVKHIIRGTSSQHFSKHKLAEPQAFFLQIGSGTRSNTGFDPLGTVAAPLHHHVGWSMLSHCITQNSRGVQDCVNRCFSETKRLVALASLASISCADRGFCPWSLLHGDFLNIKSFLNSRWSYCILDLLNHSNTTSHEA